MRDEGVNESFFSAEEACNKINQLAIDLGALKIKLQYKIVRFKVIDL